MDNGGCLIYITYKPFPEKFKPAGKMFELCAEGRLLIISLPGDEKEQEYLRANNSPCYAHCQKMNDLAAAIADQDYSPLL